MKRLLLSALSISTSWLWISISGVQAQPVEACQPPADDQYALLVNRQSSDDESRLEQVLPSSATITPCTFQGQNVIQVGTFADEDLAQSWAEYLTTVEEFQTIVFRRQDAPSPEPSQSSQQPSSGFPQPNPTPSTSSSSEQTNPPAYAPAVLEPGYAVLVRYNNQPEVAAAVRAVLSSPIGLAVYEQQPYLLVAYSTDPAVAGQVLQGLSDRQFNAFIVSSQRVVVLSSSVTVP
ncbi:MAG: hypothetical protein AAFU78_13320 [Cyanobacteria bacterium J06633_2]